MTEINTKIFKTYDIRGIYPKDLNEEVAYKIGKAYVEVIKPKKIVVGQDIRLSSPLLFKSFTKGVLEQGVDIIDIGLVTSPMMYFATYKLGVDGGVNISSSHNPPEYGGFKMVREKGIPISGESGIYQMRDLVIKGEFAESQRMGKLEKKEILDDYIDNIFSIVEAKNIAKFKVVVDPANAMGAVVFPKFFERLNCEVVKMYFELDGNFPNHLPDPLVAENILDLRKRVVKEKADLGIATDGDADRITFVDEKGEIVPQDLITALMAKMILKEKKGAKILTDIRSSWTVKEVIEENGGIPILWKVGHTLIKEKMRKDDITFAGEVSGHYFLKDDNYFESPFVVILYLLKLLTREKKLLSELIKPLKRYSSTGEINFEVEDKEEKMKMVEEKYKKGAKFISHLDGIRIDHHDWWFNIRPSNTEPLLRFKCEARTQEIMEEKNEEITKILQAK